MRQVLGEVTPTPDYLTSGFLDLEPASLNEGPSLSVLHFPCSEVTVLTLGPPIILVLISPLTLRASSLHLSI